MEDVFARCLVAGAIGGSLSLLVAIFTLIAAIGKHKLLLFLVPLVVGPMIGTTAASALSFFPLEYVTAGVLASLPTLALCIYFFYRADEIMAKPK